MEKKLGWMGEAREDDRKGEKEEEMDERRQEKNKRLMREVRECRVHGFLGERKRRY